MKILHLGMGWFGQEVGGLSRYMTQAVVAQKAAGHEVQALVTGTDEVERLSGGLARSFAPPDLSLAGRWKALRHRVRQALSQGERPLVACHFALYGRPVLGLLRQRPWVMHFHGPWALESRANGPWSLGYWVQRHLIETPTYRSAQRVITLSAAFASILENEYGVDRARIRIVPGGFDPTAFAQAPRKEEARERFGIPSDARLVVCVRRLQSRMGLENLVDAAARLARSQPGLIVAIAGKGPLTPSLQERIERYGLQGRVRLLGFVPDADLPALYAAADLSVVPTVALEGFGLIVAESMAAGTAVVASRVGALPELLAGFSEQLLADPNAEDLARVLSGALDGTLVVPSAEACRRHAEKWSWKEVTPRLEAVYREVSES